MERALLSHYKLNLPLGQDALEQTLTAVSNSNYQVDMGNLFIVPGSLVVTDAEESFEDNGDGTLTGSEGGDGTVDYFTGALVLNFDSGQSNEITVNFQAVQRAHRSVEEESQGVPAELGSSNAYEDRFRFNGKLDNGDVHKGSFVGTVSVDGTPVEITDDGNGVLSAEANVEFGSINYHTGEFSLVFTMAPDAASELTVDYSHGTENKNEKVLTTNFSGVYSVKFHNRNEEDQEIGFILLGGDSMDDLRQLTSGKIGQGNIDFTKVAGKNQILKVLGGGGQVNLSFLN